MSVRFSLRDLIASCSRFSADCRRSLLGGQGIIQVRRPPHFLERVQDEDRVGRHLEPADALDDDIAET